MEQFSSEDVIQIVPGQNVFNLKRMGFRLEHISMAVIVPAAETDKSYYGIFRFKRLNLFSFQLTGKQHS